MRRVVLADFAMRSSAVPVNRLARGRIGGELAAVALGAGLLVWSYVADRMWFDEHCLKFYCAQSAATLRHELWARWSAAALGAALILFGRPWLGRRFAEKGVASAARWSLVLAPTVLAALLSCELVLRWKLRPKDPHDDPYLPPMVVDDDGNARLEPSRTREVALVKRSVRYAINGEGNRACTIDELPDPSLPTILFTGESIAMGWGVACDASYAALVAAELGVQAVNVAAPGWGNDRAYERTLEMLPRFAHPLAVVVLVAPLQIARNVSGDRRRLALDGNGKLAPVEPHRLLRTSPLRRLAEQLVPFHSDEAIPLTRAILRATVESDRAYGAKTVFVWSNYGLPCLRDERGSSWLERTLFEGVDAPHVSLDMVSGLTIEKDDHPDERGHRAIAAAVVEELRRLLPGIAQRAP